MEDVSVRVDMGVWILGYEEIIEKGRLSSTIGEQEAHQ